MSSTYTGSYAETFTITNAKYLASKVKTDLMRLHHYYGKPTVRDIEKYHDELILLQVHDYLREIEYGFVENNHWVKALKYTARQGGILTADDDPGGIIFSDISGNPNFTSVLGYNANWHNAPAHERADFEKKSPIKRTLGDGYRGNWEQQKAYSSGGRGFLREGTQ